MRGEADSSKSLFQQVGGHRYPESWLDHRFEHIDKKGVPSKPDWGAVLDVHEVSKEVAEEAGEEVSEKDKSSEGLDKIASQKLDEKSREFMLDRLGQISFAWEIQRSSKSITRSRSQGRS